MLDCMLLPLSVKWVPTTSRQWNSWVHPGEPNIRFQNQEIATIYDPLHLLKCTRNLFLKYDVHFESELLDSQLPAIAKWEHIRSYTNATNLT